MSENHFEPAEVFHVGEFIADEMKERGWDSAELARQTGEEGEERDKTHLAIDMCLSCAATGQAGITLGMPMAERIARAFGVSAATLLALDATWQRRQRPPLDNQGPT